MDQKHGNAPLMQMPQLVGVPHHIDCCDLSVLDFERGRLKLTIGLLGDEARQSIDESGTHKLRAIHLELSRKMFVHFHHGIESGDGLNGRRSLAAAVGMDALQAR